jgi:protein TonB
LALLATLSLIWLMQAMIAAQPLTSPPPGAVQVVAVDWDDAEAPWPEPVAETQPDTEPQEMAEEKPNDPEPEPEPEPPPVELEPPPQPPVAKPAPTIQAKPKPRPKTKKKRPRKKVSRRASKQGSAGKKPTRSRPIYRPRPHYPRGARRRHQEGYVVVAYNLGADGRANQVRVLSSSPPGVFDRAAVSAVRRWRYTATGRARRGLKTRIRFQLRNY